jgi:hypothetical protein
MLTPRSHAASARAAQRISVSRSNKGLCQGPRVSSKPLQCRRRRCAAHTCHDTEPRRRDGHEAHDTAQLAVVKWQQRDPTAPRRASETVKLGVDDGAHLSQPGPRTRKPSRPRRTARPAGAKDSPADRHRPSARIEPRATVSRRIACVKRRWSRRESGQRHRAQHGWTRAARDKQPRASARGRSRCGTAVVGQLFAAHVSSFSREAECIAAVWLVWGARGQPGSSAENVFDVTTKDLVRGRWCGSSLCPAVGPERRNTAGQHTPDFAWGRGLALVKRQHASEAVWHSCRV